MCHSSGGGYNKWGKSSWIKKPFIVTRSCTFSLHLFFFFFLCSARKGLPSLLSIWRDLKPCGPRFRCALPRIRLLLTWKSTKRGYMSSLCVCVCVCVCIAKRCTLWPICHCQCTHTDDVLREESKNPCNPADGGWVGSKSRREKKKGKIQEFSILSDWPATQASKGLVVSLLVVFLFPHGPLS